MTPVVLGFLLQVGPYFVKTDELHNLSEANRIAATYYYLSCDLERLRDRPPLLKDLGSLEGHRVQLEEMAKVGIDIALVAYPADPSSFKTFAAALTEARRTPRVAPWVDSFQAAKEFYSFVPPRHWACLNGRPLIWLETTAPPTAVEVIRTGFREGCDRDPFIVAEKGGDATYAWGASRNGPSPLDVISVGPGYDDGRPALTRDRQKGAFYERSWYVTLRMMSYHKSQPTFIAIESWNGFLDATEICESREHGRSYLDLTVKAIEKFQRGETLPNPKGTWTGAPNVAWSTVFEPNARGVEPVRTNDGAFELVKLTGVTALLTKPNAKENTRRLYFAVEDSWMHWERKTIEVRIEFLDQGEGSFSLEYDSALTAGAYASAGEHRFTNSGQWETAIFILTDALFANRQSGGADVRLVVERRGVLVRRLTVRVK